jgi:hypothetical protein
MLHAYEAWPKKNEKEAAAYAGIPHSVGIMAVFVCLDHPEANNALATAFCIESCWERYERLHESEADATIQHAAFPRAAMKQA